MKWTNKVRPLVSAVYSVLELANDKLFAFMQRTGMVLQAGHASAASFTDTLYAISATLPATYDAAGYGLTSLVYTQIGRVQNFPTYGSRRQVNKFSPVAGAIEKLKGAPDYGDGDLIMADMPLDAGQVICKAAEASPNHYSLKITYPDGEIHYLDVLVCAWFLAQAAQGGFMLRTATLGICKAPVVVAAP
jgi:hypothetical protein